MVHMELGKLAEELVREGVAPLCALGYSVRLGNGWCSREGGAVERVFDLASVTKPMFATAFARSDLSRTAPLARVLTELRGTFAGNASFERLLSHRAGLAAHVPLYTPLVVGKPFDKAAALRFAADARRDDACLGAECAVGFSALYSDIGYALAGEALARHVGVTDAGAAIERFVVAPLQTRDPERYRETAPRMSPLILGSVDILGPQAYVPTEVVTFRGGELLGVVHDENAWALTGAGASGHAGMFGNVSAVLAFGCAILDGLEGSGPFAGTDLAWLTCERPGGTLRAGFDGKSPVQSSAGERMGMRAFGHLGFTGTSFWIDPDARIVVSLLTNRVSPTRDSTKIRAARPRTHDALYELAMHDMGMHMRRG
jgi:serine-type D-Ala-D-Ala carboxypeptidase